MTALTDLSIHDAREKLRAGEISSAELTRGSSIRPEGNTNSRFGGSKPGLP